MKFNTKLALTLALALPLGTLAHASSGYPNQPVKILVGYQPGGPTDLTARLVASKLQAELGQSFVVENKPGAGSNLASTQLATSPADGYTLMVAASQMTWNSALFRGVKYEPIRSFVPISKIMTSPAVLLVNPELPVRSVSDLITYAKQNPDKLNFASSGNGTVPHLSGELFKAATNIKMTHIPYRGAGPALNDLLGGQVQLSFVTALSAMPYVKDGKLRALAVVADHRLPQIPDIPTLKETGISGVDIESWNGIFAPAGTPPEIVSKLSRAMTKIMKEPDVRKVFEDQAATPIGNDAQQFGAEVRTEVERRHAFVREANLTID